MVSTSSATSMQAFGEAQARPRARSRCPGVRIVTANGTGSWPGPCTRISIGSSVASWSGRRARPAPSTASTCTSPVDRTPHGRRRELHECQAMGYERPEPAQVVGRVDVGERVRGRDVAPLSVR